MIFVEVKAPKFENFHKAGIFGAAANDVIIIIVVVEQNLRNYFKFCFENFKIKCFVVFKYLLKKLTFIVFF